MVQQERKKASLDSSTTDVRAINKMKTPQGVRCSGLRMLTLYLLDNSINGPIGAKVFFLQHHQFQI